MTNRYGIDEDWSRLSPAQCLAAGKTFVVGYISEDTTGKNITRAEIDAYRANGVAVLLVYEYSTTAVLGGAAKGHRDAGIAVAAARALGYPAGCAIAFAVDENTSSNPGMIDDYARAFTADVRAAGWRSMAYGGLATVRRCADLGLTDLTWQTYAWSGSPTVWDPRVAIRQYQNHIAIDGKYVDLDVAVVDDFGAWLPDGADMDTVITWNLGWRLQAILREQDPVVVPPNEAIGAHGFTEPNLPLQRLEAVQAALMSVAADAKAAASLPTTVTMTDADKAAIVADLQTALGGATTRLEAKVDELLAALRGAAQAETAALTPPAGA